MCLWCWHTIVTMAQSDYMEPVCPGCRTPYDVPAILKQHNTAPQARSKTARKAAPARAHLADVVLNDKRVVAVRNIPAALIDVEECDATLQASGASASAKQLCDARLFALGQHFLFGQYGRIVGAVIIYSGLGTNRMPVYSAAIRYASSDEAGRCVRFANGSHLLGHVLSCKLVPTRYCGQFLLKSMCTKRMCVELHHEHTDKTLYVKPPPAVFSVLGGAEAQQLSPTASTDAAETLNDGPVGELGRETRRRASLWADELSVNVHDDIHRVLGADDCLVQSATFDVALTPLTKMAGQPSTTSFDLSTPLTSTHLGRESSWSQAPAASGSTDNLQLRARVVVESQSWLAESSFKKDSVAARCNAALKAVIDNMPPHVPAVAVHAALPHPTVVKALRSSDAGEVSRQR
jgi:hypothetical protein